MLKFLNKNKLNVTKYLQNEVNMNSKTDERSFGYTKEVFELSSQIQKNITRASV